LPYYNYTCKKCNKNISIKLSINDDKPTVCECGGLLTRDYNKINIDRPSRKDPTSHDYWKNGKSDSEIASVIAGDEEPY
jgi:putative FmdB family regulatory protein